MNYKARLILLFIYFCPLILTGQKLRFYNSEQGIPSSIIYNVSQDSRGYIWVATGNGVSYFDGINFHTFHRGSSKDGAICSELVKEVYTDSNETCWIATSNGLQIFDYEKNVFRDFDLQYPSFKGKPYISSIIESKGKHQLFVSVSGCGVLVYDIKSHLIDHKTTNILKALYGEEYLGKLFFDDEGNLWSYSEQGTIYKVDIENNHIEKIRWDTEMKKQCKNIAVSSLTTIPGSSDVLIGTYNNGLFIYDEDLKYVRKPIGLKNKCYRIRYLLTEKIQNYDNKLSIWVGTENSGLKIFDYYKEQVETPDIQFSPVDLMNCKVHSLLQDEQGNIWVGIYQKGLLVIPLLNNKFEYIKLSETQKFTDENIACATSIIRDESGILWIGTDGGGLFKINKDGSKVRYTKYNSPLPNNAVVTLAIDKHGTLWISTYMGGITTYNTQNGFKHYSSDKELQKVICSFYNKKNDLMYFGTLGHGIRVLDLNSNTINVFNTNGKFKWMSSLFIDSSEKLWIGGTDAIGCYSINSKKEISLDFAKQLKGQTINSIVEGSDGTIWLGTHTGLYSFNKEENEFDLLNIDDGLSSSMVCSVQQDESNNLWISTVHGLSRYNIKSKQFTNYYSFDGLQDNEYRVSASFKDEDGKMFFGGINGISAFYPSDIDEQEVLDANVFFTQLFVLNEKVIYNERKDKNNILDSHVSDARQITLKHTQNSFSIDFAVLEYANPNRVICGYKLEGFDSDWHYTKMNHRRATYTNIPYGKYKFHVKAFFDGQKSCENISQKEIDILIMSPWYKQWWAYVLYMTLFMLIVWISLDRFLGHVIYIKERNENKIKELKLSMFTDFSHEIRTPLTMIMNPLKSLREKEESEKKRELFDLMYRNVLRILQLINQLMDVRKIDDNKLCMHFQNTDLIFFIKDIMKMFEHIALFRNIDFRLVSNFDVLNVCIDQINFDKVIFNIISNAFKFTPENGYVHILVNVDNKISKSNTLGNLVEICIKNTGSKIPSSDLNRIFDRFYQSRGNINDSGSGVGLHLARNIVGLHFGSIKASNIENGVVFTILIPLGNEHLSQKDLYDEGETANLYSKIIRDDLNTTDIDMTSNTIKKNEINPDDCNDKYSVIIVDNDVEFGQYLKTMLSNSYLTKFYSNANEAWNEISTTLPDAILTDLKMPETDGLMLCKKIKNNSNTNHIPVIIITSSTNEYNEYSCFHYGADHYITKPISIELLKTTVNQVIKTRVVLKNKYNINLNTGLDEVQIASSDNRLIAKVIEAVRKNIENPEYNVDELSNEVGLSRVHLNRKLKANINISPGNLIKSIRLKQAACLLANNKVNISEVAYKVGFSSHAYFSSSFKEYFGMSPSDFVNKCSNSIEKENLRKLFEN
jgi:signal transduction histidine kinase/ligand-binding sensor domain-containing protein/DNA-binding response OmpR family regulator